MNNLRRLWNSFGLLAASVECFAAFLDGITGRTRSDLDMPAPLSVPYVEAPALTNGNGHAAAPGNRQNGPAVASKRAR